MSRAVAVVAIISGAVVAGTATAAAATLVVAAIVDRLDRRRGTTPPPLLALGEVVAPCPYCTTLTIHTVTDRASLDDPRQERPAISGRCTQCGWDLAPVTASVWPVAPHPPLSRRPRGGAR